MKILFLCHRIPYPPNKGEKIRAFHELLAIAKHHEVDLFTFADDDADLVHRDALAAYCKHVTVVKIKPALAYLRSLPYLFTRSPLTLPYFSSGEFSARIQKALRERGYDRIFVYCSAMAQYTEQVENIPVIMDLVDVDSDKWTQYAAARRFPFSVIYRREGRTLREFERRTCERACHVLVTTPREAKLVGELSADIRVSVLSMGVDTEYFQPVSISAESDAPATVIFVGAMSYFPNQEAVDFYARRVLPIVQCSVPETRFLIVGHNPSRPVQELRQLPGVEVTGSVPDVRPYLARAQVSVAPFSIAAGIQSKILEALASALPVVATPRAVQGLTEDVAAIVETAQSAEELAGKTVNLLRNRQLAREIGEEGRRRVTAAYSWNNAMQRLLELIETPVPALTSAGAAQLPTRN